MKLRHWNTILQFRLLFHKSHCVKAEIYLSWMCFLPSLTRNFLHLYLHLHLHLMYMKLFVLHFLFFFASCWSSNFLFWFCLCCYCSSPSSFIFIFNFIFIPKNSLCPYVGPSVCPLFSRSQVLIFRTLSSASSPWFLLHIFHVRQKFCLKGPMHATLL